MFFKQNNSEKKMNGNIGSGKKKAGLSYSVRKVNKHAFPTALAQNDAPYWYRDDIVSPI